MQQERVRHSRLAGIGGIGLVFPQAAMRVWCCWKGGASNGDERQSSPATTDGLAHSRFLGRPLFIPRMSMHQSGVRPICGARPGGKGDNDSSRPPTSPFPFNFAVLHLALSSQLSVTIPFGKFAPNCSLLFERLSCFWKLRS